MRVIDFLTDAATKPIDVAKLSVEDKKKLDENKVSSLEQTKPDPKKTKSGSKTP